MANTIWPPPPDLHSMKELVAAADVEGFIEIHGAPEDEYDIEAEQLFSRIQYFPTADLIREKLVPLLKEIWASAFNLSDADLAMREPKLGELAAQIGRFFGPEARPQVRGA